MRKTIAFVLAASLSFGTVACAEEKPRDLTIESKSFPLATGEDVPKAIGKLKHRGTLRLTSPDSDFGGLSGIIVSPDGKEFLAITDSSHWLTGKLSYADGRLKAAQGTHIAPLLGRDGRALSGKDGDAEGLSGDLGKIVYVSFERDHRIWKYDFGTSGLKAKPIAVPAPADLQNAPSNSGLEALALLHDGRLLAMTENYLDDQDNIKGWSLDPVGRTAGQPLTLKHRMPFALTDLQQLPNGDLITLERRFSTTGGVGFQVRRIVLGTVKPNAVLDGEFLADAGMNFMIDNMEGMSIRKGTNDETLIYLLSDDNFNRPLQQTLLMMFELED